MTTVAHWSTKYLGRLWSPPEFDCWTLVVEVYRSFGVTLTVFGVDASDAMAVRNTFRSTEEYKSWTPVGISGAKEYDVVLMATGRVPVHVGLVVGGIAGFRVLHCLPMGGVCIDDIGALKMRGYRIVECYRRRNLDGLGT